MDPSITQISQHRLTPLVSGVQLSFNQALAGKSAIDERVLRIEGMSGGRYRRFINNLVRNTADARYLEVGAWKGSTLCAAINGNSIRSTVIDNWSEFGGPKDQFVANVMQFKTPKAYVNIIEHDFRTVDSPTSADSISISSTAPMRPPIITMESWSLNPRSTVSPF